MLNPDHITREELYEAVWSEPVQKLALALGISDVGLAKICKKLHVPRPGRGYWVKTRGARKLLKEPLPLLEPGQEETYHISPGFTGGGSGWTRDALQYLAEEGIQVPTVPTSPSHSALHPLLEKYRNEVAEQGWEVQSWLTKKPCVDLSVSLLSLGRGMAILQRLFEAFEVQGLVPEVLPPMREENRYGNSHDLPSRTGVRIKGIFVSFRLYEQTQRVMVPPPPEPQPSKGRKDAGPVLPPSPTWQTRGTGELILEILNPPTGGMRRRWRDGRRQVEDQLDAFLKGVMTVAERQFQEDEERKRQEQAQREAERKRQEAEAHRAELAARRYDLESRLLDVQQAEAIRDFVRAVLQDAEQRGVGAQSRTELEEWLEWANQWAAQLEQDAIQTVCIRRRKPAHKATVSYSQAEQIELRLRDEVDLWQRRYIFGRR